MNSEEEQNEITVDAIKMNFVYPESHYQDDKISELNEDDYDDEVEV
jgi:hypothetical protein